MTMFVSPNIEPTISRAYTLTEVMEEFKSYKLPSVGPSCQCKMCGSKFESLDESENPEKHGESCLYRRFYEVVNPDYTQIQDDEIRRVICTLMSEMLDNPDENGIYPTSVFMGKMEEFIINLRQSISNDETHIIPYIDLNLETIAIHSQVQEMPRRPGELIMQPSDSPTDLEYQSGRPWTKKEDEEIRKAAFEEEGCTGPLGGDGLTDEDFSDRPEQGT